MTWQPGQSGNPAGRKGSKAEQLQRLFVSDMLNLWKEGGEAALRRVMQSDPVSFCKLVSSVLPKAEIRKAEVIHSIEVTLRKPQWLQENVSEVLALEHEPIENQG